MAEPWVPWSYMYMYTMGFDLPLDGLTAGLAGHCQPDKKHHSQE